MVIGITLATIAYFSRGKGDGEPSILDPTALRASIESNVDDEALQLQCLQVCDELQRVIDSYDALVPETLDAYLAAVSNFGTTAAQLDDLLNPMSDAREATLLACLASRERLVELLDDATWNAVFDKD